MVFKCASCGSCMVYDFVKRDLVCPNCNSQGNPDIQYDDRDNIDICPICGGQLNLGKYGSAVKCGYCDSYVVSDTRLGGENMPSKLLPTRMTKPEMFMLLTEKFDKYMCLIPEIFSPSRLKEVIIEYVPYWVYEFGVRTTFVGKITESVSTGNTTITDTYSVNETWDLRFGNVPVDASDQMPDMVMDELEPFDLRKALDFKPEYLSGSNSEIFNHESGHYKEEAAYKVCDHIYDFVQEDLHMNFRHATNISASMIKNHTDLNFTTLKSEYYLLPVYKYSYIFKSGRTLDYYVNGQTREVYGTAPISSKKLWIAIAATATAFLGVVSVITAILILIGGAV